MGQIEVAHALVGKGGEGRGGEIGRMLRAKFPEEEEQKIETVMNNNITII